VQAGRLALLSRLGRAGRPEHETPEIASNCANMGGRPRRRRAAVCGWSAARDGTRGPEGFGCRCTAAKRQERERSVQAPCFAERERSGGSFLEKHRVVESWSWELGAGSWELGAGSWELGDAGHARAPDAEPARSTASLCIERPHRQVVQRLRFPANA
jgi:hypothetical protein